VRGAKPRLIIQGVPMTVAPSRGERGWCAEKVGETGRGTSRTRLAAPLVWRRVCRPLRFPSLPRRHGQPPGVE
jgi:hypothetical protein